MAGHGPPYWPQPRPASGDYRIGGGSYPGVAARTGRNPRTQGYVSVKEKAVPCFKTGKEMRERLNRTLTT